MPGPAVSPRVGRIAPALALALQLEEALGLRGIHGEIDGPLLLRQAEPGVIGDVRERHRDFVQWAYGHVQARPARRDAHVSVASIAITPTLCRHHLVLTPS